MLPNGQTVLPNDVKVYRSLWGETANFYTTSKLVNKNKILMLL